MTQPALPTFNDPSGYSPATPPFAFQGMTARVFPLRANIHSLQSFVDKRLNIVPPEIGHFRVPLPYAYLMLMDYGKLALEATNLGWLSQQEVLLLIPLEWYKAENGRWVFHDYATVAPFIFVSDDISLTLGRTVYGWPKALATVSPTAAQWMTDPAAPVNQATVETSVFPILYKGRKLESRVFLEVECLRSLTVFDYPLDTQTAVAPWVIGSNSAAAAAGFSRDALGLLRGLDLLPMDKRTTPDNYMEMMARGAQGFFPFQPNLTANTLNLKQFRRSRKPERYVYQALTNGPMTLTSLNRLGMFGEERVLLGDVSGGYSIKLYEWPALPIVDMLGLEVARRWNGDDTTIAELRPVLPFWYDVNMQYEAGYNLAYRSDNGVWHEECTSRTFPASTSGGKIAEKELVFNTTLGSAFDPVAGPFTFLDATMRVLPFLAKAKKLECFLDRYLNDTLALCPREDGKRERFTLWSVDPDCAYVYVTITDLGDVTSTSNNVGDWADLELSFLVPVKRQRQTNVAKEDSWQTVGVGLVPAFTYVDNTIAAVARSEVLGIPTTKARFPETPKMWLQEGEPGVRQKLLTMDVEVLPAIGEGQETQKREILALRNGVPGDQVPEADRSVKAAPWCDVLRAELARKNGIETQAAPMRQLQDMLALALEPLGNRVPFALYTMKQFRDCSQPDRACYQSLLRVSRSLEEVYDVREIEEPLVLRIHEFPTQPIVSLLGLVAQNVTGPDMGISWELQPIRPFAVRATMKEAEGVRLLDHVGAHRWHIDGDENDADDRHDKDCNGDEIPYLEDRANIKVGAGLVGRVDAGDPRRIAEAAYEFSQEPGLHKKRVKKNDAIKAIDAIDPQTVLETILSREWGNTTDARWLYGRSALEEAHRRRLEGVTPGRQLDVELAFFRAARSKAGARFLSTPYLRTNLGKLANDMIAKLGDLTVARDAMLREWEAVVTLGVWETPDPPQPDPSRQALDRAMLTAVHAFLKTILALGAKHVVGDIPNRDTTTRHLGSQHRVGANRTRFDEIKANADLERLSSQLNTGLDAGVAQSQAQIQQQDVALKEAWEAGESILNLARLAKERPNMQRELLFTLLAGSWKKPDFVVRRDAAGADADRIFPLAESWDKDWYEGTKAGGPQTSSPGSGP